MSEMQQPPRPTINELQKFIMFTPTPGVEGKRSKLVWSVRDGNPRVTVYTNDPKDQIQKGIISCPMNPETFFAFLNMFEDTAQGQSNQKIGIECWTSYKDKEGKYEEKTLLSTLMFGKDEQGMVWLCAISGSRPKIKFEFKISDYHKIIKGDGKSISDAEGSVLQAVAVIRTVRAIVQPMAGTFRAYSTGGAGNQSAAQPNEQITNQASNSSPSFNDLPF